MKQRRYFYPSSESWDASFEETVRSQTWRLNIEKIDVQFSCLDSANHKLI